jgi:transitional endoplasmic reticulum ATPase
MFKIINSFGAADYAGIAKTIKNCQTVFFDNYQLKNAGTLWSRMYPQESKYSINSNLYIETEKSDYPKDAEKAAQICALSKDAIKEKFTVNGEDNNFNVFLDDLRYNISQNSGIGKIYSVSSNNPANITTLKKDIPFCFDILDIIVNTGYEFLGKKTDLEAYPQLSLPKLVNDVETFFQKEDKTVEKIEKENLKIGFDDIGGCEEAKDNLKRVGYGIKHPEIYREWGLEQPKGVLLYGPPGTGKTLLAKAVAKDIGANVYSVKGEGVTSMWFGESEKNIKKMFDAAKANTPSILFIDELDSIAPKRDYSSEASSRMVGTLLKEMDGMEETKGIMIMGATNRLTAIDPALLRPGRFDKKIEVPLPDESARKQIYQLHLKGKKVDEEINYASLAKDSDKFSGADIKGIVNMTLEKKIDEIRNGRSPKPVSTEDLISSIKKYITKIQELNGGAKERGTYLYA